MTVYACKMQHQGRFLTQLHAFAAQLGTPRQGFEPGPLVGVQQVSVSWHYAVTAGERERAIALGARAIAAADVTRIEQQRAAMLGVIYPS